MPCLVEAMLTAICLTLAMIAAKQPVSTMKVEHLRCEYQTDPLGIDAEKPRLSWWLKSTVRGARQTAYQILVASSPTLLNKDMADLWDSGKVETDVSIQTEYRGKPTQSNQKVYWKVRTWERGVDWLEPYRHLVDGHTIAKRLECSMDPTSPKANLGSD
jgi:alpha-L-rhamnosidase